MTVTVGHMPHDEVMDISLQLRYALWVGGNHIGRQNV
jgi:hypothetical protein